MVSQAVRVHIGSKVPLRDVITRGKVHVISMYVAWIILAQRVASIDYMSITIIFIRKIFTFSRLHCVRVKCVDILNKYFDDRCSILLNFK